MLYTYKSKDINYISFGEDSLRLFTKHPPFDISLNLNDALIIDDNLIDIKELYHIQLNYLKQAKEEYKLFYKKEAKSKLHINISMKENESSCIKFSDHTKENPYLIQINYKDCFYNEKFKYVLGHEIGHIFYNSENYKLNKFLKSFYISIISFIFLYKIFLNIILFLLIPIILSITIYHHTGVYLKWEFLLIGIFLLYKFTSIDDFLIPLYNIKKLNKMYKKHKEELLCDLYSKNNYNANIRSFFCYKYISPICISHPNSYMRIFSSKLNLELNLPIFTQNIINDKKYKKYKVKFITKLKKIPLIPKNRLVKNY
jgi:hypothetical protein